MRDVTSKLIVQKMIYFQLIVLPIQFQMDLREKTETEKAPLNKNCRSRYLSNAQAIVATLKPLTSASEYFLASPSMERVESGRLPESIAAFFACWSDTDGVECRV